MLQRHTKTFYLIGPPVEFASEVADVLYYVLSQMHGTPLEGFQVSQIAGLPYITDWMLERDTHQRPNRLGMHCAGLWCLQASWSQPQLCKPAFTVVVQDTDFFSRSSKDRAQNMPAFETFLVSTCVDGAVPQGSLFRWNTVAVGSWRSRCCWRFRPSDDDESVTEKLRVLGALMEPPWQDVLNLRALMPDPLNDVSRRRKRPQSGRSGSQWENVEDRISMNILPAGLPCFLAQCVARPKTFEALARGLWEYDDRFQRPSFRQPLWLGYLVGATDGTTPEKLSHCWWASCVAGVGKVIRRLKQIQTVQFEGNESCVLVPGISNELMNELLLTSHCQGHAGIYAQCMRQGHTPYILDLGGDSMTFFRGVEFSNLYMDDADHCYLHQNKRLILLQWWMQDTVTGHQICTGDVTLHYAKKWTSRRDGYFSSGRSLSNIVRHQR